VSSQRRLEPSSENSNAGVSITAQTAVAAI
jgi:hypothetical protein